ncbi:MAG: rhodanese-like domain-containing protein [Bacteroidia bacterium]|nr:rhodanese-like domain-containing protein [Bacteroidia bacterium]NNL34119.1 rhodanese-like domain-containing protein [Flavobacteriaceae bacterium]
MADLSQEAWSTQLSNDDNAVILDVRTDREVSKGIIPNAIQIDIYKGQEFIDSIKKLDKNKCYYVYCKAGGRSGQACQIMNQLGIEHTYNLVGGFEKWRGEITNI